MLARCPVFASVVLFFIRLHTLLKGKDSSCLPKPDSPLCHIPALPLFLIRANLSLDTSGSKLGACLEIILTLVAFGIRLECLGGIVQCA